MQGASAGKGHVAGGNSAPRRHSLEIIASILLIKARSVQSEETRLQLQDAHRRCSPCRRPATPYGSDTAQPIEIATYLTKLCETLAQSMIGDSRPFR